MVKGFKCVSFLLMKIIVLTHIAGEGFIEFTDPRGCSGCKQKQLHAIAKYAFVSYSQHLRTHTLTH